MSDNAFLSISRRERPLEANTASSAGGGVCWGKVDEGACRLSNGDRTVTRVGGKGSFPRAYAQSRLPAKGKCTIDIALDKLPPVVNAISVGVVHESRVGQQPEESVGHFEQEAGIRWYCIDSKTRGSGRSLFGGQDVRAQDVCEALEERDVVSVIWDGDTRTVWWALNSSAGVFGPLTLPPRRILRGCKLE